MLLTKIFKPSIGNFLVHRRELNKKLENGLRSKLILVSAPAGFGKTTAICEWIDENSIPAVWFSIDNNDNDPVEFLSYIIFSIQSLKNELGVRALELLKSPNQHNHESILNLLLNDIVRMNLDFLLVLDDLHWIQNNRIFKIISYLLDHLPTNLHLVISTRSDPPLPLARLRSQNQMLDIRTGDLSFSAKDIFTFFHKNFSIKLSVEDAHTLEQKTEGWIAGLQLMALSLQNHHDISAFIDGLKGNNRFIMDYLMEEVFRKQEEEMAEFLTKTSILDSMSAPLCNLVLGISNSQEFLKKLEQDNMFLVPLDNEGKWFRYHHLFADLLRQRAKQDRSVNIEKLHERACKFYEEEKMSETALKHMLKIKNYNKSIQLLDNIAEEFWKNGLHEALLNYGNQIPPESINNSKEFSLYYSWILMTSGDIQKAEMLLKSAEKKVRHNIDNSNAIIEDIQSLEEFLGKIYVALAYLYSMKEHPEKSFDYCSKAMDKLSGDDLLWISWAWFTRGVVNAAIGELHESIKDFQKALDFGRNSGNIYLISSIIIRMTESEQQIGFYTSAYNKCIDLLNMMKSKGFSEITKAEWTYAGLFTNLAGTQFIWAELDKALEYIQTAYKLANSGKDIVLKTIILLTYSGILQYLGRYEEAREKFEEFETLVEKNHLAPYYEYASLAWKVYMLIDSEKFEEAHFMLQEKGLKVENEITYTTEVAYLGYSLVLMRQGKLKEAEILIIKMLKLANEGNRVERLLELKIQYALLHKNKGNKELAVNSILEAMEVAKDEYLLQYFVSKSDQINELLQDAYKIIATSITNIPKEFISKLKKAISRKDASKKTNQQGDLSLRELDTLVLMARNLKNQQIADKLFISLNTVKTHVRNILLKLDTANRFQAVEKAKKIGLIQVDN